MVILQGFIIVPSQDLESVKAELINHIQLTLQELGCISFSVIQDKHNTCKFDVYEEFVDQISFEQHQIRVKNAKWGTVTQHVERHYKITTSR